MFFQKNTIRLRLLVSVFMLAWIILTTTSVFAVQALNDVETGDSSGGGGNPAAASVPIPDAPPPGDSIEGVPTGPGLVTEDCEKFSTICNPGKTDEFRTAIITLLNYFLSFLGLVAVVVIIFAGVKLVASGGNEAKLKEAQKTITYAIIGLLIVFLAYAIVNWVVQAPSGGEPNPPVVETGGPGPQPNTNVPVPSNFCPAGCSCSANTLGQLVIQQCGGVRPFGNVNAPIPSSFCPASCSCSPTALGQLVITSCGTTPNTNPNTNGNTGGTTVTGTSLAQQLQNLLNQFLNDLAQTRNPTEINNIFNAFRLELNRLLENVPMTSDLERQIKELQDALLRFKTAPSNSTETKLEDAVDELTDKIQRLPQMKAMIKVNKREGPAPFTVQLDGSGSSDPTGDTIPATYYTWWYLDSGGNRVDLPHSPVVTETFREPNAYVVHLRVKSAASMDANAVLDGEATVTVTASVPVAQIDLKVGEADVSQLDYLKVTLQEAQTGLNFNPAGSTPKQGFEFVKTDWDFGDTTARQVIEGSPAAITHRFQKLGRYRVAVTMTDNAQQSVTKVLNLEVNSAVAMITASPKEGTTDNFFRFSSEQSRVPGGIKEVLWSVTDNTSTKIKEFKGDSFSHQFEKPGSYNVNLTIIDNEGNEVQDNAVVKVTSKPPVVLLSVKNKDASHPNVFSLDASNSYDVDEGETLAYVWFVDDQQITLENPNAAGSKGTYTFKNTGDYQVRVEVKDSSLNTEEKTEKIRVDSTLGVDVALSPQVVQAGKEMTFTVTSAEAVFFRYDFGDGKREESDKNTIKHIYPRAGTYNVTVTVFDQDNNDNTARVLAYVAAADTPLAVFQYDINGEAVVAQPGVCSGGPGLVVSRVDNVRLDGTNAVNRDGTSRYLDFSWNFGDGTVSTKKTTVHKFTEISGDNCYKVELTVTDKDTGKTSVSPAIFIKVENKSPLLSDLVISSSQSTLTPVVVNLSAIGARDVDGRIMSYKWYYYPEGEEEQLGTHITNSPSTSITIPTRGLGGDKTNYHFVVEITDNDNETVSSEDILGRSVTLPVTNRSSEPLQLEIFVNRTSIKLGEAVQLSAVAKDAKGISISDAKISWDFNGDGQFEDTSSGPFVSHVFNQAGNYNVTARVDYRGTTNRASVTVFVNPASSTTTIAAFLYVIVDRTVIFQDNSAGQGLTHEWDFDLFRDSDGDGNVQNDVDSTQASPQVTYPEYGVHQVRLTVRSSTGGKDDVTRPIEVKAGIIPRGVVIDPTKTLQAILITLPEVSPLDRKIHLTRERNRVTLFAGYSMGKIKAYHIDNNIYQDSSQDGIADNDIDNQDNLSFTNGSSFVTAYTPGTNIAVKLTVVGDTGATDSMTIPVIFDDVMVPPAANQNRNSSGAVLQQEKLKAVQEKTDALRQAVAVSDLSPEQKQRIMPLISRGDIAALEEARNMILQDAAIGSATKAALNNQIQELIQLKKEYAFSLLNPQQKSQEIKTKTDQVTQTVSASPLPPEKKQQIQDLMAKGDSTSLQEAQKIIAEDTALPTETKNVLSGHIQDLILLQQQYLDIESAVQRIKLLMQEAEPINRIRVNKALISLQESYGIDLAGTQQALGEVRQAVESSEKLSSDSKQQISAVLDQIGDSLIVPVSGGENTNNNQDDNQNQNGALPVTNENTNQAVPLPSEPQGTPLWLAILGGLFSFLLWLIAIFLILGILLFVGFVAYKKISGREDLDFEEFILDLRGHVVGIFQKFSPKKEATPSEPAAPPLPEPVTQEKANVVEGEVVPPPSEEAPIPAPVPEAPGEQAEQGPMPDWLTISAGDNPPAETPEPASPSDIFTTTVEPASPPAAEKDISPASPPATPDFLTDTPAAPAPDNLDIFGEPMQGTLPGAETDIFGSDTVPPPAAPEPDIFGEASPPPPPRTETDIFGDTTPAPVPTSPRPEPSPFPDQSAPVTSPSPDIFAEKPPAPETPAPATSSEPSPVPDWSVPEVAPPPPPSEPAVSPEEPKTAEVPASETSEITAPAQPVEAAPPVEPVPPPAVAEVSQPESPTVEPAPPKQPKSPPKQSPGQRSSSRKKSENGNRNEDGEGSPRGATGSKSSGKADTKPGGPKREGKAGNGQSRTKSQNNPEETHEDLNDTKKDETPNNPMDQNTPEDNQQPSV